MNDRYLFRAKRIDNGEWVVGYHCRTFRWQGDKEPVAGIQENECFYFRQIDESTICQCTGLKDKNGNLIWGNDILMCHNNPKDLVRAVFGEFAVIDVDSLEEIDGVIGWHYEVIPTDEISKYKPFCLSMPLTDFYINRCDMKVVGSIFDNPELLEVE